MSNYLATYLDVPFNGTLAKARDNENTKVIETRALDGTYIVQTVGSAATEINVEFHCDITEKRLLQAYASSATLLKVIWEDRVWIGYIKGGDISWDYFSPIEYKLTFTLLVMEYDEYQY